MPYRFQGTPGNHTVSDIDRCCWLTVIGCDQGHSVSLTGPELVERFPADARIEDIAARLVCAVCGSKDGAYGFIQERSERARRKLARKDPGVPGVYEPRASGWRWRLRGDSLPSPERDPTRRVRGRPANSALASSVDPLPTSRPTPFTIEHAGRKWSGAWELEGKDVVVSSAYGSDREPLGRRKAEKVAAGILREIVGRREG
jgi:hypothetical protein